jgi:hypothetical protein
MFKTQLDDDEDDDDGIKVVVSLPLPRPGHASHLPAPTAGLNVPAAQGTHTFPPAARSTTTTAPAGSRAVSLL